MKIINLWLSDVIDYSLVVEGDVNVLVNTVSMNKFNTDKNTDIFSPLNWLSQEEMTEYGIIKRNWFKNPDKILGQMFAEEMEIENIDPLFASALEGLFCFSELSCLDALIFCHSCIRQYENEVHIKIIAGHKHQLSSLYSLVFWLAACDKFFDRNQRSIFLTSSSQKLMKFNETINLIEYISKKLTVKSELKGLIRDYKSEVCVAWTGALKLRLGWDDVMIGKVHGNTPLIRIVQPGQDKLIPKPLLILSPSAGDSGMTIKELYYTALKNVDNNSALFSFTSVRNFSQNGLVPFVIKHLAGMIRTIDSKLENVNVKYFFSVCAPQVESIALHISLAKKKILPVLLPHSFTQSYEFSSETYKESLSFISSEQILNPLFHDLSKLTKEKNVDYEKIKKSDYEISLSYSFLEKYLINFKIITSYRVVLWPNIILKRISDYIKRRKIRNDYFSTLKTIKYNFGIVLNIENLSYNTHIDFNKLFDVLNIISHKIKTKFSEEAALNIRSKPGWTNVHLLAKSFSKTHPALLCPSNVPLLSYGKGCSLILFIQGTSAIAELMRKKTPCVFLNVNEYLTRLDWDYISYPVNIVPFMTIDEVIEAIKVNPTWVNELSDMQYKWVEKQMEIEHE